MILIFNYKQFFGFVKCRNALLRHENSAEYPVFCRYFYAGEEDARKNNEKTVDKPGVIRYNEVYQM